MTTPTARTLTELRKQGYAADVIHQLYKEPPTPTPDYHDDLRDALESLLGKPDSRKLGILLRSYRRRIFRGLFIDQNGSENRAVRWVARSATEFGRSGKPTHSTHSTHSVGDESNESDESVSHSAADGFDDEKTPFD